MDLVIASSNEHKLAEIRNMLPYGFKLTGLKELGITEEIPETGVTFIENALIKARYIARNYNLNCISDDSGLSVDALGGQPGVYSARFAGENANPEQNIQKLLLELENSTNRKAKFTTVIALILDGREIIFEGEITGLITLQPSGFAGFGYDPVFIPDNYTVTFAEMDAQTKNKISHRRIAVTKMVDYLKNYQEQL